MPMLGQATPLACVDAMAAIDLGEVGVTLRVALCVLVGPEFIGGCGAAAGEDMGKFGYRREIHVWLARLMPALIRVD